MSEKQQIEFKWVCREYLSQQGLAALRAYGREVGVGEPTKKSKSVLIDEIVAILMGEKEPIARSRRGAPVKDDFVDPKILAQIATLKKEYSINQGNDIYDLEGRLQATKENEVVLMVEDPNATELEKHDIRSIYKGQLVMRASGQAVILPLNGKEGAREVLLPANLMNMFDLREGDVLTYHVERRNGFWVATAILTINECVTDFFVRGSFDGAEVCYPKEKIRFFNGKGQPTVMEKYLEWFCPVGKGQRGLILGAPKSGKSSILFDIARNTQKGNGNPQVLILLVGQSLENISRFKRLVGEDNLAYTTYEEDADRQVFVANFILNRAKRLVEAGHDVLLLVDSLHTLANAYNETEESAGGKMLVGGLESKTLQFIKKFFGTARNLEQRGSLTMLATLSVETGNPADDLLKSELTTLANWEMMLSNELARQRVYPAIDFTNTQGNQLEEFYTNANEEILRYMRKEFLPKFGSEGMVVALSQCASMEELEKYMQNQVNK
ncbi:MAG: hypothetical protein IJW96_01745 [Clostridia bacterium]|nr:hypothetical protein [Clostridia bacterium]